MVSFIGNSYALSVDATCGGGREPVVEVEEEQSCYWVEVGRLRGRLLALFYRQSRLSSESIG